MSGGPRLLEAALLSASLLSSAPAPALASGSSRGGSPAKGSSAARDADGSGAYATHRYRNLFLEAGHTPQRIDAKIEAAYRQLFHGDGNRWPAHARTADGHEHSLIFP